MKLFYNFAVAVSALAHSTLVAAGLHGPMECKPGQTTPAPGYDTFCRCGVFFPNAGLKGIESMAKIDYCSSTKCGDVFSKCCTQAATDCFSDPRSAQNLRWWELYEKATADVADGDYRIATYCRGVECADDIYCLEKCFKRTTLQDVVDVLDEKATLTEWESVWDTCADEPEKSKEEYYCAIAAYHKLNPDKFPVISINEPDFYAEETRGCDARKLYDECLRNPPEYSECNGDNVFNGCIRLNRERLANETPANEGHKTDGKLVIQC